VDSSYSMIYVTLLLTLGEELHLGWIKGVVGGDHYVHFEGASYT